MLVLLISANPLFSEAIAANLSAKPGVELVSRPPEKAMDCIRQQKPGVILVDEAAPMDLVQQILKEDGDASRVRLVLLSCTGNEFTLLDVFHSQIARAEDLSELIRN